MTIAAIARFTGAPAQPHSRASFSPALATLLTLFFLSLTLPSRAQWDLEDSHTPASLRGIDNVGGGVAWASGTNGTVLRTEDGGFLWQTCSMPPGAEKLDFRGIQAFDENTAIVMSSGPGDLSRLYKTTDGCQTWHLLLTNLDPQGFWDALVRLDNKRLLLAGDPTRGSLRNPLERDEFIFRMRIASRDNDQWWLPVTDGIGSPAGIGLHALPGESLFAASNSSVTTSSDRVFIATKGARVLRKFLETEVLPASCASQYDPLSMSCGIPWLDLRSSAVPIAHRTPSSGIFSIAFTTGNIGVAVGGDFQQPAISSQTSAYTTDDGGEWHASVTPPHGYRSSVAYDPDHKLWITVGPNGTDISSDDGRNWRPLRPSAADPPDADKNWNALSLPFVVGPNGRIGKLRPTALPVGKPLQPKDEVSKPRPRE